MMRKILLVLIQFCCLVSLAFASEELEPDARIVQVINEVKATISAKPEKVSEAELDKTLEDLISPLFDFREMSRRSLGANWKKATKEEQVEFVDLFTSLLSKTYLKQIKENVENSAVEVKNIRKNSSGKKAIVQTALVFQGEEVSMDYRFRHKKDGWRIYDVVVENVGLVSNFRSEFGAIVRKEKMRGLLERLREKEERGEVDTSLGVTVKGKGQMAMIQEVVRNAN